MAGFRGVGEAPRSSSAHPATSFSSSYVVLIPKPEMIERDAELDVLLRKAGIPREIAHDLFHPVTQEKLGSQVESSGLSPFIRYLSSRFGSMTDILPPHLSFFSIEPGIDRSIFWKTSSDLSVVLQSYNFPHNSLLQGKHVHVVAQEGGVLVTSLNPKALLWKWQGEAWILLEPGKSHEIFEGGAFALGLPPKGESRIDLDINMSTVVRIDETRNAIPRLVWVAPRTLEVPEKAKEAYLDYVQDFFRIPKEATPGPFRFFTRALVEAGLPEQESAALLKKIFEPEAVPLPEGEQARAAEFFGKIFLGLKMLGWDAKAIHRLAEEFAEEFAEKPELRSSLRAEDILIFYAGLQGSGLSLRDQRRFLCLYLKWTDDAVREDFFHVPWALRTFVSLGMSPEGAMDFILGMRRNIPPSEFDFMPALQEAMRALLREGVSLENAQAFLERVSVNPSPTGVRSADGLPESPGVDPSSSAKVTLLAFLGTMRILSAYGFRTTWWVQWWLGGFSKYSHGYEGSFLDALVQINAGLTGLNQQSDSTGLTRDPRDASLTPPQP